MFPFLLVYKQLVEGLILLWANVFENVAHILCDEIKENYLKEIGNIEIFKHQKATVIKL